MSRVDIDAILASIEDPGDADGDDRWGGANLIDPRALN